MFLWWIPWLLRSWAFFVGILIFHSAGAVYSVEKQSGHVLSDNIVIDKNENQLDNVYRYDNRNVGDIIVSSKSYNNGGYQKLLQESNKFIDISDNSITNGDTKFIRNVLLNKLVRENSLTNVNFVSTKKKEKNSNPRTRWNVILESVAKSNSLMENSDRNSNYSHFPPNGTWHKKAVERIGTRPAKEFINLSESFDKTKAIINWPEFHDKNIHKLPPTSSARKYGWGNLKYQKFKFYEPPPHLINNKFGREKSPSQKFISNDFLNMPDISSGNINTNKFKRKKSDSKMSYGSGSSRIKKVENLTKSDKSVSSNKSQVSSDVSECNDCLNNQTNYEKTINFSNKNGNLFNFSEKIKRENVNKTNQSDLNSNKLFTANNKPFLLYAAAMLPQETKRIIGNETINRVNELNLGSNTILPSRNRSSEKDYLVSGKGPSKASIETKGNKVYPLEKEKGGAKGGEHPGRLEAPGVARENSGRNKVFLRFRRKNSNTSSNYVNLRNEKLNFETINGVRLVQNEISFISKSFLISPKNFRRKSDFSSPSQSRFQNVNILINSSTPNKTWPISRNKSVSLQIFPRNKHISWSNYSGNPKISNTKLSRNKNLPKLIYLKNKNVFLHTPSRNNYISQVFSENGFISQVPSRNENISQSLFGMDISQVPSRNENISQSLFGMDISQVPSRNEHISQILSGNEHISQILSENEHISQAIPGNEYISQQLPRVKLYPGMSQKSSDDYKIIDVSKNIRKRSVNEEYKSGSPSGNKQGSIKNRKSQSNSGGPSGVPKKPKNITAEEAGMGGSALQPPVSTTAQRFATQPAPQTAVIGSTAVLPCRVTGKVGHLQWTKDGFGLGTDRDLYGFSRYSMIGSDDEGDFSLRMNPVLLDDDALYQCQVSASDGVPGIRSQPVRLTVYVPPDPPVVEPTILNTTSGMPVELQCQSKGGRPPPEIQWVDDIKRETILEGATDSVQMMEDGKRTIVTSKLSFTPRRHHNNQSVTCLTSNQALSSPLTASISLHVFFPPEVTLSSHPEQFIEDDDATFYCDSVANPPRVTFRWFHNAQELMNETSRDLKISKISRVYHQDSISCEVSNKVGLSKKSQTMYVRFGPTFRTKPQDVMAEDGSNADLSCDVESNPTATIVWLRDGSDKIIGSGASLRVHVSRSTSGTYRCVSSVRGRDIEFPNLEGKVRVLVKGPPQIVSASEQQGRMGDTVSLECRTVSVPSPIRVTWTYKGRKIDKDDPRYDVLQDEGKGNHRNVLVIHDADSTDFGDYNCSVVNEYGVARKLIRLKEEKRVPVLLVVGGGAAVVVVAVIVVSLVFCNKKHPTNKGQCESVKDKPSAAEVNQPIANMYSAASETKLDEGPLSSFPSPFTEVKVSPLPTNSVSYAMHPLNNENRTNAANIENFERDYSTFIETAAGLRGRRRSSLTDSSIYPQPSIGGGVTSAGVPTTSPPEFCTIRRTPRTHSPTYPNGNEGISTNHRPTNNGSIQLNSNRHSVYMSPNSGPNQLSYSPPPPPLYPRNMSTTPLITSPPKSSIHMDSSGGVTGSNQEAKYIFSSEAMLKPGTLV